jgi:DNA-binding transcriptional ArsR family regulator
MTRWTFLTSHALVLIFLANQLKITGHELSLSIGITERAVRRIITDLEAEGYVKKEREGRRIRYVVDDRLHFRHPLQREKEIGILLKALGWKGKHKPFTRSNRKSS